MENKEEKCNSCIVCIFKEKNRTADECERIPEYCFPYAVKFYNYCPICGTKINKDSYYLT